jgi:hypothetical protein
MRASMCRPHANPNVALDYLFPYILATLRIIFLIFAHLLCKKKTFHYVSTYYSLIGCEAQSPKFNGHLNFLYKLPVYVLFSFFYWVANIFLVKALSIV